MSIIVLCVPQLVDFHVTRTLARAQWDILGFGPYASLPRERRMEVRHIMSRDTDEAVERWVAEQKIRQDQRLITRSLQTHRTSDTILETRERRVSLICLPL
jgi:hypothetical protein